MATTSIAKYREYFDVDEKYFPCIDDSAIEAGAPWDNTYPHAAFLDLLKSVERMLGGTTKRSVWIHGAYGTGKSQCAYALKKILEVPEAELVNYWNRYDSLKGNPDLLQKLLGHKERKIVTAYRYASGGITTPRDLFFAIQETVKKAIEDDERIDYYGENTLKESVIEWLEDTAHKNFFDNLLKKPEWNAAFSQSNADEVLNSLRKGSDIKSLMDNIFDLADKEGITAMTLDADKLKNWLKDIINTNKTKIVFVWDEFSGFFKQNRNSLDEFQKIVALCQETPFYLIVVTHQTDSIINSEDQAWSVVRQRFDFVPITLPDNIAFDLIGHAFNVKPAAKGAWELFANDLNSRLSDSRKAVMKSAHVNNPKVIKDIMPLHPMAALVLKNIATAFQSNQRSMFDFIKTSNTDDVHAFQWFIEHTGPGDDHPLLTIDMLWNFFYEKGRDNLSTDIRMILDTYPQQQSLREDEQRVLKAILIMQAIDKRMGGSIDLLKPTEQNISYAFEGINSGLDVQCKNIAKGLNRKGILVQNPIGNGQYAYGAAVLAGDQAKIDEYKKGVRSSSNTAKLVTEGKLSTALSLLPALRLRFASDLTTGAMVTATISDFTRTINSLKDKEIPWHFNAVLAFAKDDVEAASFRKMIKEAAANEEYKNIVFIDALSTPLGEDAFDSYVEYSAMAQYYQSNNNQTSKDNNNKAIQVLSVDWKNRIYNGSFIMYYEGCPEGEKVVGGLGVSHILQSIVVKKHKYAFDFTKGLTENQFKPSQCKAAAKCGIIEKTSGVVINAEKSVLPTVWQMKDYWKNPATSAQNISIIKQSIEKLIEDSFEKDGQIAIGEIYDHLENEFGFAPCNLSAFLTGFVLKEYSGEPYRYSDDSGSHEPMSVDKLAEMIGNYISKTPAPTYIVKMTADEMAFYELTEKAWGIQKGTCSSASQAGIAIKKKMQSLGLPVWSLEKIDSNGVYDIVEKYIDLVQKEGRAAHSIAITLGSIARNKPSLGEQLRDLLTQENCQEGMRAFVKEFNGGELDRLTNAIGANANILKDISTLFSVENSSLWNKETGVEQIQTLITDYRFVKATNDILGRADSSKGDAIQAWIDQLKFTMCSCEALQLKYPELSGCFEFLLSVFKGKEILPEQMKVYTDEFANKSFELKSYFENEAVVFSEIYKPYLEDITVEEVPQLKRPELSSIFGKTKTEANGIVKGIANEYRSNQLRTQLFDLWKKKTNTKNPIAWSARFRTPILKMVKSSEYNEAKRCFETLNRSSATEYEIQNALSYLSKSGLFEDLADQKKIDDGFTKLLGSYKSILTDIEKVRDSLEGLGVEAYDWDNHPSIRTRISELARAEYDAGGSDKVIEKIEAMSDGKLKSHLIELVKENMRLGLEIMNEGK